MSSQQKQIARVLKLGGFIVTFLVLIILQFNYNIIDLSGKKKVTKIYKEKVQSALDEDEYDIVVSKAEEKKWIEKYFYIKQILRRQKSLKKIPKPVIEKAISYYEKGDFENFRDTMNGLKMSKIRKGIDKKKLKANILYVVGESYLLDFKFYNAIAVYKKSVMTEQGNKGALFDIADLYYKIRNYPFSIVYYKRYIQTMGEGKVKRRIAKAYKQIGHAYQNLNDVKQASYYFKQSFDHLSLLNIDVQEGA